MSSIELEHLIKMLNQIADNVVIADEDEAQCVAIHVNKFWTRSMKETVAQYAREDGSELKPAALNAVSMFRNVN